MKLDLDVPTKDILKEVADYDVIGLSSIFTSQTRMVKEVVIAIKKHTMEPKNSIFNCNDNNGSSWSILLFFQKINNLLSLPIK